LTSVISILAFLLAIAVLVAVHEFGHYWVAKRLGFKVLRFSIGFGKPLWTRVGRDTDRTEYCLSAIPLGGYVKLLDEREGQVAAHELHRSFTRRPVVQRIAVLLAGPAMNLLFASLIYAVLAMLGNDVVKPVVGQVRVGTPAFLAGLESGDEITAVGNQAVTDAEQLQIAMFRELAGDCRVPLTLKRHGSSLGVSVKAGERCHELTEPGELLPGLGLGLMGPRATVTVHKTLADGAGAKAGILAGDRLLAVAGRDIANASDFIDLVSHSAGQILSIELRRGAQQLILRVTVPTVREQGRSIGKLGIELQSGRPIWPEGLLTHVRSGPLAALGVGVAKTWAMSSFTVEMLWRILTGQVSAKNISGPISIAEFAGLSIVLGFSYFLGMLAIISVSLGVLNLLPVPLLDGGQIVFQLAEGIKGSPVSERAQVFGQQIGIALLVILMSLAFYNDISRHLN
jgi:regulator of sigma E protease